MNFSIPTNWQRDLIYSIDKRFVDEFYGKLAVDFVGGGRPPFLLPQISKKRLKQHIAEIHTHGKKFNYLLSSTCLGNKELTIAGNKELFRLLDWLVSLKVDAVTVSVPYLVELIKSNFPQLKVYVSVMAGIDSIERAKYWEDLGVDKITLSCLDVNRDFALLRQMRKSLSCKLQLIANLHCLYGCPFFRYHSVIDSHASQTHSQTGGFTIDYCSISCRYIRITDLSKYISSGWIRPEDVRYYEETGIDSLKFVDRDMTTEAIARIVSAYANRSYEGNLFDLFCTSSKRLTFNKFGLMRKVKYLFHPFFANPLRLYFGVKETISEDLIYIDNKKLNGFIKHFLEHSCTYISCRECGYCERIAREVIQIEPQQQQDKIKGYSSFLNQLISGSIFKYFK
jgi:collagenase-like PrtC family protease